MKVCKWSKYLALGILAAALALTGCKFEDKTVVRVAALKGPTGMGMVNLMEKDSAKGDDRAYAFTLLDSPDDLVGKIVNGEVEIAAVPTNMAAMLYNKTGGKIELAAVNTLGVLYVLEDGDQIKKLTDLKGKTVASSGKGSSADFVFQYLLKRSGLNPGTDVAVEFKLQHAELAAAMVAGDVKLGILPQPHATLAMMKNPKLHVAMNITEEWEKVMGNGTKLPMGCIIVNKAFATSHKEQVNAFLDSYKASVDFTNQQPKEASVLMEKYGILPKAAVAIKAIPLSNIVYVDAGDAKSFVDPFLKVMYDFEPKSVGGKLPDEAFYYQR